LARLIIKTSYITDAIYKENYLGYIATREGVEKYIADETKDNPATKKQINFINRHFNTAKDFLEYDDYIKNTTMGNASELITMITESEAVDPEIYLKYISERPKVDMYKNEEHGLWNLNGKADLEKELKKIGETESVVWTHIFLCAGKILTSIILAIKKNGKSLLHLKQKKYQNFIILI
jgi:hypothetical protein